LLFALLILAQASPFLAGPPGAEVLLESDVVTYAWDGEVVQLDGHVVVRRGDGEVRAAKGRYDRRGQRISLEGGVLGVQGRQVFLADRAEVDLSARVADLAGATLYLKESPASIDAPRAGRNALTLRGIQAIQDNDLPTLGQLMNICQGMLNALQVSTPELEKICAIARENGALGAKLTGGGGGGSIVAICDGDTEPVVSAIRAAGFQALPVYLGADLNGA
jgi:hypothetical protein